VLAVADAFDAMTAGRPYRRSLEPEAAADEIDRCAGTQFDPEIAETFLVALGAGELVWGEAAAAA
jgi:HD-GYP domain-containing protein (c-di-GMP phosphodiesterase class II)